MGRCPEGSGHLIHRLVARSLQKAGQYASQIVGLVTPATHVSDPTLIGPLRELESQIIDRATQLADDLPANPPAWYRELRGTVSAPPDQGLADCARQIAAYRERYEIRGHDILGDPPPVKAIDRRRQHARLMSLLAAFSSRSPGHATLAELSTPSVAPPQPN